MEKMSPQLSRSPLTVPLARDADGNFIEMPEGSIRDDAARSFAVGFYSGSGDGRSVNAAYEVGRAAIDMDGIPAPTVRS